MKSTDLYSVQKVEPCVAPKCAADGEWHRYVVANSSSRIVGRRQAPLSLARRHAEHFAGELNERLRTGRSVWSLRSRSRTRKS